MYINRNNGLQKKGYYNAVLVVFGKIVLKDWRCQNSATFPFYVFSNETMDAFEILYINENV